jgi:hypothetical protein
MRRPVALILAVTALCGSAGATAGGLPQAGTIVGTFRVSVHDTPIFGVRDGSLFAFVLPENFSHALTLVRVDPSGGVTRRRLAFRLANYLSDVATGPDGVYAGTSVIKRFSDVPDRLLRVDPTTLAIRARAWFSSQVRPSAIGHRLWASVGDGRVVRLDPSTLAVEASRHVARPPHVGPAYVSEPVLGLGSLWVVTGDKLDLELVRMDPATLAVRSTTRIPRRLDIERVIADSRHVYLVGSVIAAVGADGKLHGRPIHLPDFATAELDGDRLVAVAGDPARLDLLDARGGILARTRLGDAGSPLTVEGSDVWAPGDAGEGNGIVHVRLARR